MEYSAWIGEGEFRLKRSWIGERILG